MSDSSEEINLLLQFMAAAIRRKFNVTENQAFVSLAPVYSANWGGNPVYQVCPGSASQYEGGRGAQDGGDLLRRHQATVTIFYKLNLDSYSKSVQIVTQANTGLLDLCKKVRALFALTCFPTIPDPASPDDYLLFEPLKWESESPTVWEDEELGVARRDITFSGVFGVALPTSPTLSYGDYH